MDPTLAAQLLGQFQGQDSQISVAAAAEQCRDLLRQCTDIPVLMRFEWAENRLAEFKLWTSTTGALADGAASLDARLAAQLATKNLVKGIVILLTECLRECQRFALRSEERTEELEAEMDDTSGTYDEDEWWETESQGQDSARYLDAASTPRGFSPCLSDDSSPNSVPDNNPLTDENSQLSKAQLEVEQIISHLTRIGLAIRKSGTSSRLHKADRLFHPNNHGKLRKHLEVVILAKGHKEGVVDYHIDPGALTPIQERLILANLRRRNRFAYAQRHAQKLAVDRTDPSGKDSTPVDFKHPALPLISAATTSSASAQTNEVRRQQTFDQDISKVPAVLTATSASAITQTIDGVSLRRRTLSRAARTNITTTAAKVSYPKPPRWDVLRYFQCPCCSQVLPDLYREKTMWKKHLMADICPYTCILNDCPKPEKLYVTQDEWAKHIERDHGQCWQCPVCSAPGRPPVIFPSMEVFKHHLQSTHSKDIDKEQYSTLVEEAARPVPLGIISCPLCDSTGPAESPDILDHITEHLHNFALRSLPWSEDKKQETEAGDPGDPHFRSEDYFDQESQNDSVQNILDDSDRDSDGSAVLPTNSSITNSDDNPNSNSDNVSPPETGPGPRKDSCQYTVGWICALLTEFTAAMAFLEETHQSPHGLPSHDNISYAFGRIGSHNVVIASLSNAEYGTASASKVVQDLLHSFSGVEVCLMVGIGGGVPSSKHDVRLGDVVASHHGEGHEGLFQYRFDDKFSKTIRFRTRARLAPMTFEFIDNKLPKFGSHLGVGPQPWRAWRETKTAVRSLEAQYQMEGDRTYIHVTKALEAHPQLKAEFSKPPPNSDRLYRSNFVHPDSTSECEITCGDHPDRLVLRRKRGEDEENPIVHYGRIATSARPMNDAVLRDELVREGILCFETAAAGLEDRIPCLVVRGICDYSDSHKNKQWHGFAAMTAAAYAADVLRQIPSPQYLFDEFRATSELKSSMSHSISGQLEQIKQELDRSKTLHSMLDGFLQDQRMSQMRRWLLPSGEGPPPPSKWLQPPDQSSYSSVSRPSQHEDTGIWFLEGVTFAEWESGERQNLCLYGIPGSGKTVLSRTIFDRLSNAGTRTTLGFFFDFRDPDKQTLESLLRSLAWQLHGSGIGHDAVESLHASCLHEMRQPGIFDLALCLSSMIQSSRGVNIVIDALDECITRDDLMAWLDSVTCNLAPALFKLIVTGRPELALLHTIPGFFGAENCVILAPNAVIPDVIRLYVDTRLQQDQAFATKPISQSLLDEIRLKVVGGSNGIFRWAVCQMEALARCSPEAMRSVLHNLPADLDETYGRILDEIPEDKQTDVIRLLQFLVFTGQPLTLPETNEVIATRVDVMPPGLNTRARFRDENHLLWYCSSLVHFVPTFVYGGDPWRVQLSHFTVKRYLMSKDQFQLTTASIAITRTVLAYLKGMHMHAFNFPSNSPLAGRAAFILMDFARHAEADNGVVAEMVSLLRDQSAFNRWRSLLQRPLQEYEASPLYFTCKSNLLRVTEQLLEGGVDVNEGGGTQLSAIHIASREGHFSIVKLLLEKGANPNEGYLSSSAPLQVASQLGHRDIAELLLKSGAEIQSNNPQNNDPLTFASIWGHLDVAKVLIDFGADINAHIGLGGNALCEASRSGHIDVIELLLNNGARIYDGNDRMATIEDSFNPIKVAKEKHIADLIWERGLYNAVPLGEEWVVEKLLQHLPEIKPNPHLCDEAIQIAAERGYDKIARLLRGGQLYLAASTGDYGIVKALLDGGVDPNATVREGHSALEAAVKHPDIVRLLIQWGAEMTFSSDRGSIRSSYAERSKTGATDKHLLDFLSSQYYAETRDT